VKFSFYEALGMFVNSIVGNLASWRHKTRDLAIWCAEMLSKWRTIAGEKAFREIIGSNEHIRPILQNFFCCLFVDF